MYVSCGSLHVRHIGFGLSYDTAALLVCRVFYFLFLSRFWNQTAHCRITSILKKILYFQIICRQKYVRITAI